MNPESTSPQVNTFSLQTGDSVGVKTGALLELETERDLLRLLIDNLPDYIFVKDLESRFILVNEACARQLGLTNPEQAKGKTDADFVPGALAQAYRADEVELMRSRQTSHHEEPTFHKETGQRRCSLTTKMPWLDSDGNVKGLVGIGRDITELKVTEEKLEKVNKELIAASRQAGMSEVATSVLHNVGNVLNSVNVSAGVLHQKLGKSKATALMRISGLLEEHQAELGPFFTSNEKGRQLLEYIKALGNHLEIERQDMLKELEALTKWVEHIKEIVAMQQSYARRCGPAEIVSVGDLVNDALSINSGSFARHDLKVTCRIDEVPPVTVEKHKVLQILVNVLRNAKYACDETLRTDKEVTIRVCQSEPDKIKVVISDNGVGIAQENLTRIFSHGFTTRRDGHGFGLHSSALAAKEMGGRFWAESEGVGKGATFVLELPVNPTKPA